MATHNNVEKKLLDMYNKKSIGDNPTCLQCKKENKELSNPVACWLIGDKFQNLDKRILFVGKNARGNCNEPTKRDVFDVGRNLWNNGWAYWTYTAEIVTNIFGDNSPEYIAFTNMVKCNNSPDKDTTTNSMKEFCIEKMKVLRNEIMIIKPTHIIFYTGRDYDYYMEKVFDDFIIRNDITKKIGKRNVPWREADAKIDDMMINVLRVCHPERKKKVDYIYAVSDWIRKTRNIH